MSTDTVLHQRHFERLVESADGRSGHGADTAFAILFAALAVSVKRLGRDATITATTEYLHKDSLSS